MKINEDEYRYLFFVALKVAQKAADDWLAALENHAAYAASLSEHPDWASKEDTVYLLRQDINYFLRAIPRVARENPNFLPLLGVWLMENAISKNKVTESMEAYDRLMKIIPAKREE